MVATFLLLNSGNGFYGNIGNGETCGASATQISTPASLTTIMTIGIVKQVKHLQYPSLCRIQLAAFDHSNLSYLLYSFILLLFK